MFIVKKEELAAFLDVLKQQGAKVDTEDMTIAFVISPTTNPLETEYWGILEESSDTVRIKWDHTPVEVSGYCAPVMKSGPTQGCTDKIREALEEVGKK